MYQENAYYLPKKKGKAVKSMVFLLPTYSIKGPPAIPPNSALSGIIEPIQDP
jgi:hypothetical protein